MILLAGIDPGLTTGVCQFCIDEQGFITQVSSDELDHLGVGHWMKKVMANRPYCGDYHADLQIVCERFTITTKTAKNSQAPWSLEVTGLVRWYAERYGFSLYQPRPSETMSLISNDVLKRAGLYVKGEHARDAARAALYYAVAQKRIGMQYLLAPEDLDG